MIASREIIVVVYLSRVQTENLGRIGRSGGYVFVESQFASEHTMCVEDREAVFHSIRSCRSKRTASDRTVPEIRSTTVGNFGEIVLSQHLLSFTEGAIVSGSRLNDTRGEATPEGNLHVQQLS